MILFPISAVVLWAAWDLYRGKYRPGMQHFEAVHGSAPDLAGKNQANLRPSSCLQSLCWSIWGKEAARRIRQAVETVLKEGTRLTPDLGGCATTTQYTAALCKALLKN